MQFKRRPSGLFEPDIDVGGIFRGQIVRDGKVIDEWEDKNLVVGQGLDAMLSTTLCGAPQITNWYMAPFAGNYQPVSTDTAATIVANASESTAYTAATRQAYNGVESNQSVNNAASPAQFTFNASASIYGAFLISSNGKQSTSGVLFSATQFSAPKNVTTNDQLLLSYTASASAS